MSLITNRDARPRRTVLIAIAGLVIAVILLGAGGFLWFSGNKGPLVGGPFVLEDGNGHQVTNRDFRGKYMLVYFGYTYCPDVCPTTLNTIAEAIDKLGQKANEVQPIFITVDPKRDTPAVVKQYTTSFSPRLMGLTGTPEQIATVAKEYRVYYAEHRIGPKPDDYAMDHTSVLYLMGPDGSFLAPIRPDQTSDEMAKELANLIS
ncbi:MAG: SCO family protein [Acetobacteraceae bacterium]|nr:SCO family protein [Acetobacteraceae bacterium]